MPTGSTELGIPTDLWYVFLLFLLFVIPRFLQRYRLPSAITSLLLGVGAAYLGLFQHDTTITLLATFGIVALFLFAGLEIDFEALRPHARVLGQHLAIAAVAIGMITLASAAAFALPLRPAALVALALLTPSAGFILASLDGFGLTPAEQLWISSKAIAAELLALAVLFLDLQTTSIPRFGISLLALAALVVVIPQLFRIFAVRIVPFAPRSEFAFLLMTAVICAYATRKLGVYYLVGAFIVGVAAQRFRERLPAMSSERMLHAVEAFASVFAPFYFFKAGLQIRPQDLGLPAFLIGAGLLVALLAVRLGLIVAHRRFAIGEAPEHAARVGVALMPTLVFTLVIADILREQFAVSGGLLGGLVLYTVATTLLPGFVLGGETPSYDAPRPSGTMRRLSGRFSAVEHGVILEEPG